MDSLRTTYTRILDYLGKRLHQDPIYEWILEETASRGIPEIQITPEQGRLLHTLVSLLGASRVLEIGTLSGYSAVWMARGLRLGGCVTTLELDPRHAELARETFDRAGVSDRIDLRVGPAMDTLATLEFDGPLDLVFIDADKGSNEAYFEWAEPRVRPGGMILVDNVLLNGRVLDRQGATMDAVFRFNERIFERYGDDAWVLPFYKADERNLDGVMMVRKRA